MALSVTTLTGALSASFVGPVVVGSTTGFQAVGVPVAPQVVLIDSEYMLSVYVPVSGTFNVSQRGFNGTAAVAHNAGAAVCTSSSGADFPALPGQGVVPRSSSTPVIVTINANGAITVPADIRPVVVNLTKGSALSSTTLAAPTAAQDGLEMTFTSQTAFAHVITATSLINDGATGAPHTTLTFAAFAGASIVLVAQNALWNVVSNNNVVIT
jgi:hypothetical protein